ncbi:uncharacterized protein CC84DRAFT_1159381 [Paraphaeosphaeria sporulosa]|uniref:Uncharacterized protein n=1 Tax=Paraphaeosphaeria sporulosa TaxID=1460663 RepID=A0A177CYL4_9PLEO|nr:uncharacterized protein CC84DRAFT_1159381 [Paraphaeosphaeria sporulosa]OAG11967.1 hypothetical protein CC84DRAFT_1159381 [Paraphaeosphaeria sporulosa]
MRSLFSSAALLTAALAAPITSPEPNAAAIKGYLPLTVTVFNDVTGAHAAAGIDTSGHFRKFYFNLFRGSAIDREGKIIATSMQLSFPAGPLPDGNSCGVYGPDKTIGFLDARHTYLELDGQPGKAVKTDVSEFIVKCDIYVVME